jgi:ribonucleoside-diphosphate reductase alpha chain
MVIKKIKKRDGRILDFDREKIINAIFKAAKAVGGEDIELARQLAERVVLQLEERFPKEIPSVEDIQDTVEKILIENGHAATAKAYIIYRKEREEARKTKEMLGVRDELKLPVNTIKVLKARYLLKDEEGNVIESTGELFRRVARHLALVDMLYSDRVFDKAKEQKVKDLPVLDGLPKKASEIGLSIHNVKMLHRAYHRLDLRGQMKVSFSELLEIIKNQWNEVKAREDEFYSMLSNFEFMPNSPTLMNAGAPLGQLSACFVLPIGDSLDSIFDSLKFTALIHQSGGGTGFSFSKLRPNGDTVKSTKGIASGPLSFMRVFDIATEVIKQGGKRRGANMGIMRIDHPDVLDFITSKDSENRILTNFNISVAITDKFMKALENDAEYDLLNPKNGTVFKKLYARQVWEMITYQAWKTGDPGVIFIDEVNRHNPTPHIGQMEATNPCVAGDMFVPTEYGLLKMEKLADGHHTSLLVDRRTVGRDDTEISPMLNAWQTGTKQTYKVVTKAGYEIVATADHKIMTKNGWVKLSELTPGKDQVLIQPGPGMWNTDGKLPFQIDGMPKKWSRDLGQAVGLLVGDGWLRDGDENKRVGYTFSNQDSEIMLHVKNILNTIYGKEIKEVKRENGVYHLSYHGKKFVEFFKNIGVKPVMADIKEVPETIFTATEDAVSGFLQGLFTADGTIGLHNSTSNAYVRLTSKSEKLLKQVQLLLLNFGIKCRIYNRSRPPRKIFSYVNKKGEKKIYDVDGKCYELNISRGNITTFLHKIGFMCNKHENKVELLGKRNFYRDSFSDEISSVQPNDVEAVYDLTEPNTHSFICNGIVVSNCGEQPLLPYESCNLGSINLSKMVKEGKDGLEIDWEKLERVARSSVQFLDNVIDANSYPIKQIEFMTHANRKIGLGVMGFAEMLIKLGMRYDSEEALKIGEKIMKFITETGRETSIALGKHRGSFPNFKGSEWDSKGAKHMRNATVTTIAPTGTISIIADCSSGIEPLFAVAFVRKNVLSGDELVDVNKLFEKYAKDKGFYSEELMHEISNTGSLEEIEGVPKAAKELFKTAHDIDYEWHIRMQAAFQKYTDNAVSKTINMRNDTGIKDVDNAYALAHKLKCKGVTIYRDMSKSVQVIHIGDEKRKKMKLVKSDDEKKELSESDENCPVCKSKLYSAEGCFTCLSCGYSKCG